MGIRLRSASRGQFQKENSQGSPAFGHRDDETAEVTAMIALLSFMINKLILHIRKVFHIGTKRQSARRCECSQQLLIFI